MTSTNLIDIVVRKSTYAVSPSQRLQMQVQIVLKAPKVTQTVRTPVSICMIIDKSGSMSSVGKLDYAKQAAIDLVNQLTPTDKLGIVVYDSQVSTLCPLMNVKNKKDFIKKINTISPGSCTNLSGGLQAGIELLNTSAAEGTKRIFLLSDGQANEGIQSNEGVAAIAGRYRSMGIAVSSIGLGSDYNENMMKAIAESGGGQYYYVQESKVLPGIFAAELNLTMNIVTYKTRMWFEMNRCTFNHRIPGYTTVVGPAQTASLPPQMLGLLGGSKTQIEPKMGDIGSEEERKVLLMFDLQTENETDSADLGTVHLSFSRTSEGGVEEQISAINVVVTGDLNRQDELNSNSVNSRMIEAVLAAKIEVESNEAREKAMREIEAGRATEAQNILLQQKSMNRAFASGMKSKKMERKQKRKQAIAVADEEERQRLQREEDESEDMSNDEEEQIAVWDSLADNMVQAAPGAVADSSLKRRMGLANQHFAYSAAQGPRSHQGAMMKSKKSWF
ncbi:putative von Willebrand factor type A domain protein [Blattamonas nauphoetae]|uniref:von Willebrand factor type A domain protein n=1 Tax=Blattamonas nauphoetae TaxID=2049346 RepID=A0ABQ9Y2E8_9EUKA|nr:putative von Willebrand factor type A domain protein [Blattamonas nauphoetae]